jgi:hypothetical protein
MCHLIGFAPAGARHDDGEFVPTQPCGQTAQPRAPLQSSRELSQGGITHGMAELIVDLLQIIDVDHEDREGLPRPDRGVKLFAQACKEESAVPEIREVVSRGSLGKLNFSLRPRSRHTCKLIIHPPADKPSALHRQHRENREAENRSRNGERIAK